MEIGSRIKQIRKQKKMTLQELSQKSGVALATLSRIENKKMTGTVKSHQDIARVLDVSLPQLYSGFEIGSDNIEIQKSQAQTDVFVHNEKASFDILTKNVLSKKMMPIMLKLTPGAKTANEESPKGTEKLIHILQGKMQAVISDKTYSLNKGDTLYFDGSLPHHWINNSDNEVRALCIITPPAL